MISLKQYVYETLSQALDPVEVFYFYPSHKAALPNVSYYEAENRTQGQADTIEYLTELAYVVDVWGRDPDQNTQIALTIDQAMSAAGFRRAFAYDLFEPDTGIYHTTMRYRALSDPEGTLYQ